MQISYIKVDFVDELNFIYNLKINNEHFGRFKSKRELSFDDRFFVLKLDLNEMLNVFCEEEGRKLYDTLNMQAFSINTVLKWCVNEKNLTFEEVKLIEELKKLLGVGNNISQRIAVLLKLEKLNTSKKSGYNCFCDGCVDKVIKCHNIPESWLDLICDRSGKYVYQNRAIRLKDYCGIEEKVSISDAGVDYIYCNKHDSEFFRKMEYENWKCLDKEIVKQCICKSYNSYLFSLQNSKKNYKNILSIVKKFVTNKKVIKDIKIIDFDFYNLLEDMEMKLNNISTAFNFDIDFEYVEEKVDTQKLDIASNCCIPYKDTFGEIDFIFCGIIPKDNKLIYWVANLRNDKETSLKVHNFNGMPDDMLKNLVLTLSFMSKQTFINPNSKYKYDNLFMDIDLEFDRLYKAEEVYKKLMDKEFTDKDGVIRTFKYYFVSCKELWNLENKE